MKKYKPRFTIEELARQQGVKPLSPDNLPTAFWPEDENVDDFVAFIRELRRADVRREIDAEDQQPALPAL